MGNASVAGVGLVVYVNPELQRLRVLVESARGRLAELEAGFTVEKAQVEAMKARLFVRLRPHFQRRDQLRASSGIGGSFSKCWCGTARKWRRR